MKLLSLISLPNEPFLEKWARLFRFKQADCFIAQQLDNKKRITLIDFGCGQDILFHTYLAHTFPNQYSQIDYIGLDPLLPKNEKRSPHVRLYKTRFEDIAIKEKADVITLFAVLEHVDDAQALIENVVKMLKSDGIAIITTPSPLARLPLEFFSHVLGIISTREIEEHKRYPTKNSLLSYVEKIQKKKNSITANHTYFEAGLNNLLVIRK